MKAKILTILTLFLLVSCASSSGSSSDTTSSSSSTTTTTTSSCSGSTSNQTACGTSASSATISVTGATLSGTTGCITNVNTVISSDLPSWATDNFKCQVAYTSGSNYIFKSVNLPNHNSFYWCSAHSSGATSCPVGNRNSTLYEALPGTNYAAGTNVIGSQNLIYTIPATPTLATGTLTSTQGGLVAIGITANGLAIFNNAAAPPDNLSTEASTFDNYGGHPTNVSVYHHHAAVNKLSSSMADSTLIGVALDGYLIYAEKCDNGTVSTADDFTPTANTNTAPTTATGLTGNSATTLDELHGHTTTTRHLSTATYHYHYAQDPTATIKTIMGSYFRGTIGSVSN
ncbi:MAG: YHYH protein [Leptospiraceae bacterium]|nr:YHYH protein [Leptospiraceae bacterium]